MVWPPAIEPHVQLVSILADVVVSIATGEADENTETEAVEPIREPSHVMVLAPGVALTDRIVQYAS